MPPPTNDESIDRFAAVQAELEQRWPESRIDPTLTRIAALVELLGDPHRAAPALTIAGTNGKTSTARMIDTLLLSFGLRTGRVTSPHLHSVTERIAIDGRPIPPERFVAVYDDIAPYLAWADERSAAAGGPPLSYFEVLTGMSFAAFADAPVEVAVLEVGMGGRWDAVNVADAAVAVVTPIARDHAEYLGEDIASIAAEKAGIIKAGSTAVIAAQPPPARAVLRDRAGAVGAPVLEQDVDFGVTARSVAVGGQTLSVRGLAGEYTDLFLPLHGEHQAHNAARAIVAVEAFLGGGAQLLDSDTVAAGLAAVTSPGRLEVVRRSPTVVVDAAHNPAGAATVAAAVAEAFAFPRVVGVVGVLADKDVEGILAGLDPLLEHVYVTTAPSPRALPAAELGRVAAEVLGADRVTVVSRLPEAVEAAMADVDGQLPAGGAVLVTGSVTVAAQGRLLLGAAPDDDGGV